MPYKNLIVFALFAPTHSVLKHIFSDLFPKSQYPISWVSHCQAWNGIKNCTQMYVVYLTQAKFYQMTSVCDLKQTGSTAVGGTIPQTTLPCCDLLSPQHCLISHTSLPTSDLVSLIFNGTRDHPLRCNSRLNTEWKIQISPVLWVCGLISHTAQPLTTKFCVKLSSSCNNALKLQKYSCSQANWTYVSRNQHISNKKYASVSKSGQNWGKYKQNAVRACTRAILGWNRGGTS